MLKKSADQFVNGILDIQQEALAELQRNTIEAKDMAMAVYLHS